MSRVMRDAALVLASSIGLVGVVLLVWLVPPTLYKDVQSEQARVAAEASTRTGLIAGLAGLAALGGLVITARTYRLAQQGHITDRYTRAIEQLGSDKLNVRVGGIYALERITADSKRDQPTAVEVLSTFIRENSREQGTIPPQEKLASTSDAAVEEPDSWLRPPTDVQAALNVLGRLPVHPGVSRADLSETHLAGARLIRANLSRAALVEANLSGAQLTRANLAGAQLVKVNLSGAQLDGADLSRAALVEGNLAGAQLVKVNLSGAQLDGADLSRAALVGANLAGARLIGANLSRAALVGANLSGAQLDGTEFSGAQLDGAVLSGADLAQWQLDSAYGDAKTRLPTGLRRPPSWVAEDNESPMQS